MYTERDGISQVLTKLIVPVVIFAVAIAYAIASAHVAPIDIVVLTAGILGMGLLYRNLFWGVLLFLFLIPSEVLLLTSSGATALRFLGMGIMLIWVMSLITEHRAIVFRRRALPYLLFVAWAVFSLIWAPNPASGFQFAFTYAQLAVMLVILLDQISSVQRLRLSLVTLAAGGMLAVLLGLTLGRFENGRLLITPTGSSVSGLTSYGYPLAFSLALLGVVAILGQGKPRWVVALMYLAGLYPLIGVGLRGAMLATAIGIVAGVMIMPSKKVLRVASAFLAIGLLIGAIDYLRENDLLPELLTQRLTVEHAVETRGSERLNIWDSAFTVLQQQPVAGLGLNQFNTYVFQHNFYKSATGSHNDYIEALVDLGIIGAGLLIAGDMLTIIYLYRARRYVMQQDMIWLGGIMALMIASIVGQNFVNLIVWKYVWIIRAIAIAGGYPSTWQPEYISIEIPDDISVPTGHDSVSVY